MTSGGYSLSKSSFLKLEQCHKAFFLHRNHPYLRDKVTIDKQLTFKRGHDVGYFARQLFPSGTDVSKESKNILQAVELTNELVQKGTRVVYEAAFIFNSVLIMVDILVKEGEIYHAYEVKSSLKISETYLKDAYLQYYVLKNVLPGFDDMFLVTLNPAYVLENEVEPKKLFRRRSVKIKAEENFAYFEFRINEAREIIERNAIPDIAIGRQCFRPYQCDYFGSCWKNDIGEDSIFNIPLIDRGKLFEWHSSGLRTIGQLTKDIIVKPQLSPVLDSLVNSRPSVRHEAIRDFLSTIKYPAIAMDMEIWSPAIPQVQGTRCFEQLPFLVSFYDGKEFSSFFTDYFTDEREQFARALIRMSSDYESVIVYDRNLEINIINALIKAFPALTGELEKLKRKFTDVFEVFLGLHYYHPRFKSNFSLKVVSSVLLKDVNYPQISSGLEAMNYFEQYRLLPPGTEKDEIRNSLIEYCNTDCLATYRLLEFLREL